MLSRGIATIINHLPKETSIKCSKSIIRAYIKKYATIKVKGFENIEKDNKAKIFVCNHLSNSDALVLNEILKEYNPTFVAGIKLSNNPVTNIGTTAVRHINIKPNSADKDALVKIIKLVKAGNNLMIFPEGTRSRTASMIEGKKGIVLIARLSKAEIIPISIWGSEKLLPINADGDMSGEKWNRANVTVSIGKGFYLPPKDVGEGKHEYDNRCLNCIMKNISINLPEKYRGVYK